MARASYLSDFERTVIRAGHARGLTSIVIGKYLGRTDVTVRKHIGLMRTDGTITDLPFDFIVDDLCKAMKAHSK